MQNVISLFIFFSLGKHTPLLQPFLLNQFQFDDIFLRVRILNHMQEDFRCRLTSMEQIGTILVIWTPCFYLDTVLEFLQLHLLPLHLNFNKSLLDISPENYFQIKFGWFLVFPFSLMSIHGMEGVSQILTTLRIKLLHYTIDTITAPVRIL